VATAQLIRSILQEQHLEQRPSRIMDTTHAPAFRGQQVAEV
jgi:hypothetical protein